MEFNLTAFSSTRLLVVGDVMLDRYWYGSTARISPEAPVPVVHIQQMEDRLGGSANVAFNIAQLTGQVALCGLIGNDTHGEIIRQQLQQSTIKPLLSISTTEPTITKLRMMSRNQQLLRVDFESTVVDVPNEWLIDTYQQALMETDIVILSDYGKGMLADAPSLIAKARQQQKKVIIDPKGNDFQRYANATAITPNLAEFEAVVGHCVNDMVMIQKAESLCRELNLEALLITLSERGMILVRPNHTAYRLPTHARTVYDVTGAGDTVIAVLALALASNHDWPQAVWLANLAAGLVVAKVGTATVTLDELRWSLHEQGLTALDDVMNDRAALTHFVKSAQARGEKVVFTNGCFDILHAGHVQYLEQARQLGDHLIVAVNDDASVKRLKGAARPINSLAERLRVLNALACVNKVIAFSEDTPEQLIQILKPDVLVKGGDYQIEQIVGHEFVLANGGSVQALPYVEGLSTSTMLKRMQLAYQ